MRLLIDAGNTRLKWILDEHGVPVTRGASLSGDEQWLKELAPYAAKIERIAVSTVASESRCQQLHDALAQLTVTPVCFYWSEASRNGLTNAYSEVVKMGADRWHAMYAGWRQHASGFVVIDAGSAITVDYVAGSGEHLGGYILPGKQMMLRSLAQDAARIGFDSLEVTAGNPGRSTTECVQHGVIWLWEGLIRHLAGDCQKYGIERVLCTGGDAPGLMAAGLAGTHVPDLVLAGLGAIDAESPG